MLKKLRKMSMELRERFRSGLLTKEDYVELSKSIDLEIKRLEEKRLTSKR